MSRHEPFRFRFNGKPIAGVLSRPDRAGTWPVVLVCDGLPDDEDDPRISAAELGTSLAEAGLAVATFSPAEETTGGDPLTPETLVDQATAVVGWLVRQDDLDRARFGVLGCGSGAIIAAGLAGRTSHKSAASCWLLAGAGNPTMCGIMTVVIAADLNDLRIEVPAHDLAAMKAAPHEPAAANAVGTTLQRSDGGSRKWPFVESAGARLPRRSHRPEPVCYVGTGATLTTATVALAGRAWPLDKAGNPAEISGGVL